MGNKKCKVVKRINLESLFCVLLVPILSKSLINKCPVTLFSLYFIFKLVSAVIRVFIDFC